MFTFSSNQEGECNEHLSLLPLKTFTNKTSNDETEPVTPLQASSFFTALGVNKEEENNIENENKKINGLFIIIIVKFINTTTSSLKRKCYKNAM